MGLQIPHFTAPSAVHGTGLFSRHSVAAGAVLWLYEPGLDRRVRLASLPPSRRERWLHFGYVNPQRPDWLVVCGDQSCYWNFPSPGQSANAHPSDRWVEQEAVIVASRAIAAGEELLIHPSSDADYFRKMGLRSGTDQQDTQPASQPSSQQSHSA